MSTLEGGQYVLLVKALRQNRSGQEHAALVEWFESGVGHQVWRTVHSEHAHVLQPTLTPRKHENMSNATKRKCAQSTGPAKPIWKNCSHSHIKASKARQRQAAKTKAMKDSMCYFRGYFEYLQVLSPSPYIY
ncbi:hypothetical protein M9434_003394 [Picochlorum sp. BPE23]|nr:hypothetical protein M9434_003394 [Picochlorum sp. BPE23]